MDGCPDRRDLLGGEIAYDREVEAPCVPRDECLPGDVGIDPIGLADRDRLWRRAIETRQFAGRILEERERSQAIAIDELDHVHTAARRDAAPQQGEPVGEILRSGELEI